MFGEESGAPVWMFSFFRQIESESVNVINMCARKSQDGYFKDFRL